MKNKVALQKTVQGWKFIDESELETYVWDNLEEIFELKPLARQLYIKGELCDIIGIGKNNQLTIIELKNTQDRYIINQLTRYYENLREEQPFKDQVDYEQEIKLLAICPNFHRHNLIDVKHSRLNFELFTFSIICKEDNEFYFSVSQISNNSEAKLIKINYQQVNLQNQQNDKIPEAPRLLLDWLGALTETELENLKQIRQQILSFDHRIEEKIVNKSIVYASKYGKDKFRQCAEFSFDRKSKKIILFLWLIIPNRQNKTIVRMQIDTTEEYLTYCQYIPVKEKSISWSPKELDRHCVYIVTKNSERFVERFNYKMFLDETKNLVNRALKTWLERIN
ncbi:endonuclease NucS domain-containing protein [Nodularia sphaerocarpa]|uniref:endonuclease NucS domain-containing protein n=1 Tax=Nodularia sphaerocarpa TaxID=137816 RepID=UPI001EFBA800|nr:endonuclease NucS domain-containing protein [Nodularia sphaerocarpa]MDB9372131.1 endonuclease NucS [Nodularia sphaerocarpa CS-585]MDB9379463.1 endonuclease NucS [Nodularia sphaerocarpa CS-585A2]ULP73139.1 Endonuclease NucS [Nodularia sphaerocarpa UHCC 0038]